MPSEFTLDGTLYQYVAQPGARVARAIAKSHGVHVQWRIGCVNAWRHATIRDVDPYDDAAVLEAVKRYVREGK